MNPRIRSVLVLGAALALTGSGCKIMEPTTTISGTILGAPFKVKTPQNQNLSGLLITANNHTNGGASVSVAINSLSATTDPNVVAATAAGQAQLMSATANLVTQSASATQQLLQQLSSSGGAAALAGSTGGASVIAPVIATKVAPASVPPIPVTNAPAK
jgi:hypothetical protein